MTARTIPLRISIGIPITARFTILLLVLTDEAPTARSSRARPVSRR
jgi:hypothetical protein